MSKNLEKTISDIDIKTDPNMLPHEIFIQSNSEILGKITSASLMFEMQFPLGVINMSNKAMTQYQGCQLEFPFIRHELRNAGIK